MNAKEPAKAKLGLKEKDAAAKFKIAHERATAWEVNGRIALPIFGRPALFADHVEQNCHVENSKTSGGLAQHMAASNIWPDRRRISC